MVGIRDSTGTIIWSTLSKYYYSRTLSVSGTLLSAKGIAKNAKCYAPCPQTAMCSLEVQGVHTENYCSIW